MTIHCQDCGRVHRGFHDLVKCIKCGSTNLCTDRQRPRSDDAQVDKVAEKLWELRDEIWKLLTPVATSGQVKRFKAQRHLRQARGHLYEAVHLFVQTRDLPPGVVGFVGKQGVEDEQA